MVLPLQKFMPLLMLADVELTVALDNMVVVENSWQAHPIEIAAPGFPNIVYFAACVTACHELVARE